MEAENKIEDQEETREEENQENQGSEKSQKQWPIVPRYVRYDFTDQEKLELSEKIARAVSDIAQAGVAEKTFKTQIKSRKQQAEAIISDCASKLNEGYEMKNIDCRIVKDYEAGLISYESVETGEVVEEREMTPQERQMELTESEVNLEGQSEETEEGEEEGQTGEAETGEEKPGEDI